MAAALVYGKQGCALSLSLVYLVIFLGTSLCDRKLTTTYNPGCNISACLPNFNGSALNIAYVKAESENDTLHYLFSSVGVPSVLVLKTDPGSGNAIHIDWESLVSENQTLPGAVSCSQKVLYSFGVAFTKLFEYNDTSDKANMMFNDDVEEGVVHKFESFLWDAIVDHDKDAKLNTVIFNTSVSMENSTSFMNGSLSLKFTVFNHTGRTQDALPHLLYNDNITQLDFTLNKISPLYKQSRFGLEVVVLSEDSPSSVPTDFHTEQSIDDEYTPGVFKVTNWVTNKAEKKDEGFIQWKPVCYVRPSRSRSDATYVRTYTLMYKEQDTNRSLPQLEETILYAYYGQKLSEYKLAMTLSNVSFGLSKDGFYTASNYTVWTANIGYGSPPIDSVSLLVIGIISAGLGLPVLIIMFGGIYVCVKKKKKGTTTQVDVGPGYSSVNS
ncbi:glycosylated lysosomal membrane protein-like [Liolophura sinensis]|uniref:glycosylated lysosomal membrane protein-like n=1 Tax=Liolophura sinensis TaxID=3198878 RepID=UPI0031597123